MIASLPFAIRFDTPLALAAALAMLLCAIVAAIVRRPALPPAAWTLAAIGAALIALAAGSPHSQRRPPADVAVMVDLSPSTRGAAYREPAELSRRITQLLGPVPYRLYSFAGDGSTARVDDVNQLPGELPADETIFAPPPDARAILLFSDARFRQSAPAALPPVYVVVDPALEHPADARIERLEAPGEFAATIANDGDSPRTVRIGDSTRSVDPGRVVVTAPREASAKRIAARLNAGDRWPENDALELIPPPPARFERWWIAESPRSGPRSGPDGWRVVSPSDLPTDSTDYLSPSIIVLDNVPADAIAPAAMQRLEQYVRELGGGLLILGGDRAFAAGGYVGTPLDALSPLASAPPAPTLHWILLADASGSMASGIPPRFRAATDAMLGIIPLLPADDRLSTASFARELRWWTSGRSVRETLSMLDALPPRDLEPRGPTNLAAALDTIAADALRAGMPSELLILTDADATIDRPADLAARLSTARVRVHLLATAAIGDNNPVRAIVEATGGKTIAQSDAARWAADLKQLLRAASPPHVESRRIAVAFASSLHLPPRAIESWNRTWPKEQIESLATGEQIVMAATRREGLGRVTAAAFAPAPGEVEQFVARAQQAPRDPRFAVDWDTGPLPRVTLDAVDRGAATQPYINGLRPLVRFTADGAAEQSVAMRQTAPGRYEAPIPDLRTPRIATLIVEDRAIDRIALAGRYPREFDAIGNDRTAMRALADRSGGRVIEPAEISPLDLRGPAQPFDLTSIPAILGASLIAAGIIRWRRTG